MTELKPCPFCGQEATHHLHDMAAKCPSHVGWLPPDTWNTRPRELTEEELMMLKFAVAECNAKPSGFVRFPVVTAEAILRRYGR